MTTKPHKCEALAKRIEGDARYGLRSPMSDDDYDTVFKALRLIPDAERVLEDVLKGLGSEQCWFDHHGNCQAHFVSSPCEVATARALLLKLKGLNT